MFWICLGPPDQFGFMFPVDWELQYLGIFRKQYLLMYVIEELNAGV